MNPHVEELKKHSTLTKNSLPGLFLAEINSRDLLKNT